MDLREFGAYPIRTVLLAIAIGVIPAGADVVIFRGKVVLEDGSTLGRPVAIQRMCLGFAGPHRESTASTKTGEYYVRLYLEQFHSGFSVDWPVSDVLACYLEASVPGYVSTRVDLGSKKLRVNSQLPNIVLSRPRPGALVDLTHAPDVPKAARKPWDAAVKRLSMKDWAGAEAALQAVVSAAPNFGPAWAALGGASESLQKLPEARRALERAIELDPKRLPLQQGLLRVVLALQDWVAAVRTSDALILADTTHTYLDAYMTNAAARYQVKDYDGALKRISELIRIDKRHEIPRAEYLLGLILEARRDLDQAAAHLKRYLDQNPRAADAAKVRERLANLGKQPPAELSAEITSVEGFVSIAGEAPVPGGLMAFAAIAGMPQEATYHDFFLQYCRSIIGAGEEASTPTRDLAPVIRTFIATIPELEQLGDREGDRVVIRLAMGTAGQRMITGRVLALLGWRLVQSGQTYDLELGDQLIDAFRQRIPAAFGIDELEMRDAIVSGRPFQFEIPVESARLVGGASWAATLQRSPLPARGPVDLFLGDWRFASAYAGLAAMETETAAAVASSVGLVPLISQYPDLLARYGEVLTLAGNRVAAPGGVDADPVWLKIAGTSPANTATFIRALLEKDHGILLSFFFDLSHADAAHQRFVTSTPARGEMFYRWYRDSIGPGGPPSTSNRWQAVILQKLRIDAEGRMQLPGGRRAWIPSGADDAIFQTGSLESLAGLILLEEKRARPLDAGSVSLLKQHFEDWRYLFPYFEKLPGLAAPQFRELAAFTGFVSGALPPQQAVLIGQWHSLVELIVLAGEAGSLDAAQSSSAFGQVCAAMRSANPSAGAIAILREIAGGSADTAAIDEAVATRLLRLTGERRNAFERVKQLQGVPPAASLGAAPEPAKLLAALSGIVYAALLSPHSLPVANDPLLLAKHNFLPGGAKRLFADSGLVISNAPPGSHLKGGFGRFVDPAFAQQLRAPGSEGAAEVVGILPSPAEAPGRPAATDENTIPLTTGEATFRASGRIVEAYATVIDGRGRYMDDLDSKAFVVEVAGRPTKLFAFENRTSSVSVALLFDATGSMSATLPSLKRAALQLIDVLRPGDSAAVYSFNDRLTEQQPFTTSKTALKRGVLRAHPAGPTALYDALVGVSRNLAQRRGKKVIIVFTDGSDNSSMLTAETAIQQARSRGIPIYTIAQGEALNHPDLVQRLAGLSRSTGGAPFLIHKLEDIDATFRKVSDDLVHGYLLAFQPPPSTERDWHQIRVTTPGRKGLVIRAREGYYSE